MLPFLRRPSVFVICCLSVISRACLFSVARAEEADMEKAAARWITPQSERAVALGLKRLAARQNADGSYGSGRARGNVGICGLAGLAFLASGSTPGRGDYGSNLQRCVDFILANAQPSGLINGPDTAMHGTMFKHGFATLFLAECQGMTPRHPLRETIGNAVKLIVAVQNQEGGWRYDPRSDQGADMTVTTCQVIALRAAKGAGIYVPPATIEAATAYIRRGQNPDGGFMYMIVGSDIGDDPRASKFPRSAAAVTALYAVGMHHRPEIAKGLDYLMGFLPIHGQRRDMGYYYYGQYYAAQAFWLSGGARWERWFPAVRDDLVARQQADGAWPSTGESEDGATAMACLALQTPNNCLPTQQR
jgi:hypothetical protein